MTLTGHHLIGGHWQRSNPPSFSSVNPRNKTPGEMRFAEASEEEVDAALIAATRTFEETRTYSTDKLAGFLNTVADEIEGLGNGLMETADLETGLGLPRLSGECTRTTGQLRAFARILQEGSYVEAIIDTALPQRTPAPRPDIRRMLFPIGPIAVFTPNNFPLAFGVAGGDTASAFAAGCPVIAKGHPSHPGTSEWVARAILRALEKADFPRGFFSLLQGRTPAVGQALVRHPGLAGVGFTGSQAGGRAIFDLAASRPAPIPVYAEMGSTNPVILLPHAIKSQAHLAANLAASVTLGSGQFCTNPGLILLFETAESTALIRAVGEALSAQTPGVLLNEGVEKNLSQAVSQTLGKSTVSLITGGKPVEGAAYCFANTVMQTTARAFLADPELQTEHFGPATLFVTCQSQAEMEAVIRNLEGNLTATIHAGDEDLPQAQALFQLLREKAGRLIFNGFPTGVEVVYAQHHGGPYPATTAPAFTSVGMTALKRWMRPVAFQNFPDSLLPPQLQNGNPTKIWRLVDEKFTNDVTAPA